MSLNRKEQRLIHDECALPSGLTSVIIKSCKLPSAPTSPEHPIILKSWKLLQIATKECVSTSPVV
jgi:hypothetical protein